MEKLVISLTSYPARINTVHQVIESLFRQQEQADEIVLWLSVLEFPNKLEDLPEQLRCLIGKHGFRIEWVDENIRSHKKYFYALRDKETIVITVDDDMCYSELMVSILMDSYRNHPHAISARNVHLITKEEEKISPYLNWEGKVAEYIGQERMDLCAIGVNGILYPPECRRERWLKFSTIMEYAEDQDDLWLKFNEIVDKIPVVYTGLVEKDQIIENSQDTALFCRNVLGGNNDTSIQKLSKLLMKDYKELYQQWFEGLMSKKEFLHKKRRFYDSQLSAIIAKGKGKNIYICGAGKYAHIVYEFIKSCGKEKDIAAFLVTREIQNENYDDEITIKQIGNLGVRDEFIVICGVGERYRDEMMAALKPYKFHVWVDLDLLEIEMLLQREAGQ